MGLRGRTAFGEGLVHETTGMAVVGNQDQLVSRERGHVGVDVKRH